MEKSNCQFGIDILKGEAVRLTTCKGECPEVCGYWMPPLGFEYKKRDGISNIKK